MAKEIWLCKLAKGIVHAKESIKRAPPSELSNIKWISIVNNLECTDASTVTRSLVAEKTLKNMYLISIFLHYSSTKPNTITNKKGEEYKTEHELYLQKISDYTQFLLKDKLLKKLVDYYLLNFENNEELI